MNPNPGQALAPNTPRRYHAILVFYGLVCLLLPVPFIWLHITTPSDGARLSRSPQMFTQEGVAIFPYESGGSLLHEEDIVTAVDGTSIEAWMRGLLTPGTDRPTWQVGQTVIYSVLRQGNPIEVPIILGSLPLIAILRQHWTIFVFIISSQVLASFVYAQRPEDPAARALFVWAFTGSNAYTWSFYLQISDLANPLGFWLFHLAATGLWLAFWAAVVHMTLVFPKPLFNLQHLRRWFLPLYLSPFLIFAGFVMLQWRAHTNMLTRWNIWATGQTLVAAVLILPGLVLIVLQYITSRSAVERIKTRWVIFGTLISLGLGLVLYFLPFLLGREVISPNTLGLVNFPFVISMAIAIWRYHLFDIDLIIRRTLVYSSLSLSLALVYFLGVTLLQTIFSAISGQSSAVAIVLSTLAIAALFTPLRKRIQDFIDRRFFRQKYNAEQALAEFAAVARSETNLEQLSAHLTQTVRGTLQPVHTSLWLCQTQKNSPPEENR